MSLRRVRGTVLRLVRRRLLISAVGVVLLLPAVWLESGAGHGAWWVDGVSLILGATGRRAPLDGNRRSSTGLR